MLSSYYIQQSSLKTVFELLYEPVLIAQVHYMDIKNFPILADINDQGSGRKGNDGRQHGHFKISPRICGVFHDARLHKISRRYHVEGDLHVGLYHFIEKIHDKTDDPWRLVKIPPVVLIAVHQPKQEKAKYESEYKVLKKQLAR